MGSGYRNILRPLGSGHFAALGPSTKGGQSITGHVKSDSAFINVLNTLTGFTYRGLPATP